VISIGGNEMAQLIVRNLEEGVKARIRRRANRHGQSMEEEVRDILRNAIKDDEPASVPLGTRIHSRFARIGLEENLAKIPRRKLRPAIFRK
jgi:antitoxin FitA